MALTRLQLGELFLVKGGSLERKFLGCVLDHSCQIHAGGYANPNANQLAWKEFIFGSTREEKEREARKAMEWGLAFNSALQAQHETLSDPDLSWITAEYTKTWTPGAE